MKPCVWIFFAVGAIFASVSCKTTRSTSETQTIDSSEKAPRVRTRLKAGSPDLLRYSKAVGLMKDTMVPGEDQSWYRYLAMIHLENCAHGNWFILPWHRAYLRSFENVGAYLLKDPSFTVPYWDWTKDPELPAEFKDDPLTPPPGSWGSPGGRVRTDVLTPSAQDDVNPDAMAKIMDTRDFISFGSGRTSMPKPDCDKEDCPGGGMLENGPHSAVHMAIGGASATMATMKSPLDPIFWLHHANVDRLWVEWVRKVGKAASLPAAPPQGSTLTTDYWLDYEMPGFVRVAEDGTPVIETAKVGNILDLINSREAGMDVTYDVFLSDRPQGMVGSDKSIVPLTGRTELFKLVPQSSTVSPDIKRVDVVIGPSSFAVQDKSRYNELVDFVRNFSASAPDNFILRLTLKNLKSRAFSSLVFVLENGSKIAPAPVSSAHAGSKNFLAQFQRFGSMEEHAGHASVKGDSFNFDLGRHLRSLQAAGADLRKFSGEFTLGIYVRDEATSAQLSDLMKDATMEIEFSL